MNHSEKPIVVALAGNPNSGKTTIFNNLTGANQHVGNYPGVTVEKKEGFLTFRGRRIKVIDLPGTYSLSAHSVDEVIARNSIIEDRPDVVVDIVDASNIERNLYLTTQLAELGLPVVVALNMSDVARDRGVIADEKQLSQLFGLRVVPTVGNKRQGMDDLLQAVIETVDGNGPQPALVNYGREIEGELAKIAVAFGPAKTSLNGHQPRWMALKLFEGDAEITKLFESRTDGDRVLAVADTGRKRIETLFGDTAAALVSDRRYGFISGACSEAVTLTGQHRHDLSDKIDLALIHPILGLPIFAFLMWLMFNLTFTLGEKPMGWIETGIGMLSGFLTSSLPPGLPTSLLVDGIIAGVGGVIVFLPNVMLLFLAIAVLEDTGYMARAAFVMDRVMHKIGLHGKSFIPMLIGFGCTVPAYMASRIIDDKTDRLVTMHVTTFMSCGARLPVYILVCGAFWPAHAGNVVFSIYVLGVLVAVGMVKLLRRTRFRGMSAPFIMELPPYRVPTLRSLVIHMWERSWMYLRKAGTIILGISIIIWFLMTFPVKHEFGQDYVSMIQAARTAHQQGTILTSVMETETARYEAAMGAERIEYSFAGRSGKFIEPILKPLGFDWRLGIALISGIAAKEVVVSTMGTIYGVVESGGQSGSLRRTIASDPKYTKLTAYAFLVFVLLYMPCMASMAVFLRETGSVKELLFQFGYTLGLAWTVALVVYQGGRLLGLA